MKQLYLQGLYNEVAGRRDQMLADLSVLLDNPAGIADHGNISDEIKLRLEELSKFDGLLSSFDKYFRPREGESTPSTSQPTPTAVVEPQPEAPTPTRVLDEGEES
tara:strand:- start:140 stop:454 length:315 start_codon:yes stop_codon:yes gene_type:complete